MEKYYCGRNFSVTELSVSLINSFTNELENFQYQKSWLAFDMEKSKKSLVVVAQMQDKADKAKEKFVVFDILLQEKIILDELLGKYVKTMPPWRPEILKSRYVCCELQGDSLIIGAVRQLAPPQNAGEAGKMLAAYLFAGPFYLHKYFWDNRQPEEFETNYYFKPNNRIEIKIRELCEML